MNTEYWSETKWQVTLIIRQLNASALSMINVAQSPDGQVLVMGAATWSLNVAFKWCISFSLSDGWTRKLESSGWMDPLTDFSESWVVFVCIQGICVLFWSVCKASAAINNFAKLLQFIFLFHYARLANILTVRDVQRACRMNLSVQGAT